MNVVVVVVKNMNTSMQVGRYVPIVHYTHTVLERIYCANLDWVLIVFMCKMDQVDIVNLTMALLSWKEKRQRLRLLSMLREILGNGMISCNYKFS